MPIHSTAVIDSTAEIDPTADIGAYTIVEGDVHIGPGTRLYPHAFVGQGTRLGARCQIHPFAVVGHLPQDLKYTGQPSYTEIGDETVVREHASIHRGTIPDSTTVIGQRCFLMATAHIGHNCIVGDDVIMANDSMLAGHVELGRRVFVSGQTGVHQFVRIGEMAMLGGASAITMDVPPFMLVGRPGYVGGPNVVGLRRAGMSPDERQEIRACYRLLYRSGLPFPEAIAQVVATVATEPGQRLAAFLRAPSKRGYMGGRRRGTTAAADQDEP